VSPLLAPVRGAAAAFALPLTALRLLVRERRLWAPALVPFALSALAFGVSLGVLVAYGGTLHAEVTGWLPTPRADGAGDWLWVAPARAALWLLGKALFLAVAGAVLVAAFLLASLLASPFHEVLSRRVEHVVTGRVEESDEGGALRAGLRAARDELRRLAFFALLWLGIAAAGAVVPGGPLFAPPALTLLTLVFLPLDYASYTLDRRRLSFRQKRAWLRARPAATLGFGAAAFALCAVPGLNLLAMPVLVVAGTLLALDAPTDPRGALAGTSTSP
jgi:uncharacterized protein involved in cysteine biosynthesis